MKISFTETGWKDYVYWTEQDRKTLRQIIKLLADIERNGYEGMPAIFFQWNRTVKKVGKH